MPLRHFVQWRRKLPRWTLAAAMGMAGVVGGQAAPVASAADCTVSGPSLQSQIDAAPEGSVLHVVQCLYRETAVINKALTLDGGGGAEIRGSDVWLGWSSDGGKWISSGTLPAFDSGVAESWQCTDPQCAWPEQVFLDGINLTQVARGTLPGSGEFALDTSRHVVLGDDPNGHSVEVSTRTRWLETAHDNVTIQGFIFRHAANGAGFGALGNDSHAGWTLQDNKIFAAHGPNVGIGGTQNPGTQTRILRNEVAESGFLGISGFRIGNVLIQGNNVWYNNTAGFFLDWAGGGVKVLESNNIVMDNNDVHDNFGPGLWCDWRCSDVTYSNNRAYYNVGHRPYGEGSPQIFFEVSDGTAIYGNTVWGTTGNWPAIYVSSSANADVHDNLVAWSDRGIQSYEQNRCCHPAQTNNNIHNNWVVMAPTEASNTFPAAFMFGDDFGGSHIANPSANNHGTNNVIWYSSPEDGAPRFQWGERQFPHLVDFANTSGGSAARYASDAEAAAMLQAAGVPGAPTDVAARAAEAAAKSKEPANSGR